MMEHLTVTQIFQCMDRTLDAVERDRLSGHIAECPRCRNELDLQRAIALAVSESPLVKASEGLRERVMERILAPEKEPLLLRTVSNAAALFAAVVLFGGAVFVLSRTLTRTSVEDLSGFTIRAQSISAYYESTRQFLSKDMKEIIDFVLKLLGQTDGKFFLFSALGFVALVLLDRFVLKPIMKKRS